MDATTILLSTPESFLPPHATDGESDIKDPFHFSYQDHPIYQDPYFQHQSFSPSPVLMSRYYRHVPSIQARRNDGIVFAVGVASYYSFPQLKKMEKVRSTHETSPSSTIHSRSNLFESLDALVVASFGAPPSKSSPNRGGVEAHLTSKARVFILLYGNGIRLDGADIGHGPINITGLSDEEWKLDEARVVHMSPESEVVVGDGGRVGDRFKLPMKAVAVERAAPVDFIRIHHPSSMAVNGNTVRRFCVLFARPESYSSSSNASPASSTGYNTFSVARSGGVRRFRRFPYPRIPVSVPTSSEEIPNATGTQLHITNHSIPVPNRECPVWLHDLWRAPSRNASVADSLTQPRYWRTWHPSIDPVYWCYYNHEHGSYPGKYRPLFGYTAYNNPDNTTLNGRQAEPHEGFKVFPFIVRSGSRRRVVVATVHMKLAMLRRMIVRHHTMIFAVLDEEWKLEMELQMKMDFGASMGTLKNKSNVAMDSEQQQIAEELRSRGRKALRRINILNVDEGYPATVDRRYLLSGDVEPRTENIELILQGIYERWSGPLTTCMESRSTVNPGVTFDIRNPSTGVRRRSTSAVTLRNGKVESSVQMLSGDSGDRMIVIPESSKGLEIGIEHCDFDQIGGNKADMKTLLRDGDGVFYTDPYMREVKREVTDFSVRQYISPTFETVRLPVGKIVMLDSWPSGMEYGGEGNKDRHFLNPENAILGDHN